VVDCRICDQAQGCFAEPFPENNILIHCSRLQLLLLTEIKDLECPGLSLQGNDILGPVHNGTVGLDGSADDIAAILEFDDNDFGGRGSSLLFADADEGIGLECLGYRISSASQRSLAQFGILTHELNPIDACYKFQTSV